jgi:hypothetical protein
MHGFSCRLLASFGQMRITLLVSIPKSLALKKGQIFRDEESTYYYIRSNLDEKYYSVLKLLSLLIFYLYLIIHFIK